MYIADKKPANRAPLGPSLPLGAFIHEETLGPEAAGRLSIHGEHVGGWSEVPQRYVLFKRAIQILRRFTFLNCLANTVVGPAKEQNVSAGGQ